VGFLQLIAATELAATYDSETRTLLLLAHGQAQSYTSGIHFTARTLHGGRGTFQLIGWVGPLGKGTTPYDHLQRFEHIEFPGAYVQIADAGHPGGVRVPVEVIPGAASAAVPAQEVRRISVGDIMELRAAVGTAGGATQFLEQDTSLLALESAGIQNPSGRPEIVWNLRGLKAGETHVKLVLNGGHPPIHTSRIVRVIIAN